MSGFAARFCMQFAYHALSKRVISFLSSRVVAVHTYVVARQPHTTAFLLTTFFLPASCVFCCCRTVAQERSLLTGEVGMVTIKMLGSVGKLDGFNSTARFLGGVSDVWLDG